MTNVVMQKDIEEIKGRLSKLEVVLILGEGEKLPLAEIVRNLTTTVSNYIAQKDKEEQQRKDDWNRVKWIIIGLAVPSFFTLVIQAIVFYFKVLPVIDKLSS